MKKHLKISCVIITTFICFASKLYGQVWHARLGITHYMNINKDAGHFIILSYYDSMKGHVVAEIDSFKYMIVRRGKIIKQGQVVGGFIPMEINAIVRNRDIVTYYDFATSDNKISRFASITFIVPYVPD